MRSVGWIKVLPACRTGRGVFCPGKDEGRIHQYSLGIEGFPPNKLAGRERFGDLNPHSEIRNRKGQSCRAGLRPVSRRHNRSSMIQLFFLRINWNLKRITVKVSLIYCRRLQHKKIVNWEVQEFMVFLKKEQNGINQMG